MKIVLMYTNELPLYSDAQLLFNILKQMRLIKINYSQIPLEIDSFKLIVFLDNLEKFNSIIIFSLKSKV